MDKIIIVGTGRKAKEVKDFIERYSLYEVIGFSVNEKYMRSDTFEGLPVYPFERLGEVVDKKSVYTFAASSHFNYLNRVKRQLYEMLKENGYMVANLISPKATVRTSDIGDGNWINDYTYIDESTSIGSNNVLCNFAYIAHYSTVASHNFFGIRSCIGGGCHFGSQSFIGMNVTMFNSVNVGDKCVIGAGTVIKKNVNDYCMVRSSGSAVEVYQYDADTIETKLAPMDKFKRGTYDAATPVKSSVHGRIKR